jgi:uncharacterized protein with HEPN domain
MKGELGDEARLRHIYDAILEIETYTHDVDIDEFLGNSMMRFACIKQIEIIGEAGNHVTKTTQLRFSEVEWRKIVGLRNIVIHEYFGIDFDVIWGIILSDIPDLKVKIEHILNQL